MEIIYVLVGLLVLGVIVWWALYNGLIGRKNAIENSYSTIDVQLKLRHDLIPNLVGAVKGAMEHERGTLEKLVELRNQVALGGKSAAETVAIENEITKKLSSVMIAVENYPQLKANENVLQLQRSLNEVEAQIAAARRAFNAAVTDFNNAIEMMPTSVIARRLGYRRREVFVVPEAESKNPNVSQLLRS